MSQAIIREINTVDDDGIIIVVVTEKSEEGKSNEEFERKVKIKPLDLKDTDLPENVSKNNEELMNFDTINRFKRNSPQEELEENENIALIVCCEKPRKTMVQPEEIVSFVDELRNSLPELREDENLLIEELVDVMRKVRLPPPPLIKPYEVYGSSDFKCVFCMKSSSTAAAADRHYQWRHGPRYLKCFACGVDFRFPTNLYKHEKRCRAPDARIVLKARGKFLGRKGKSRPFLTDQRFVVKETRPPNRYTTNEKIKKKKTSVQKFQCMKCPSQFKNKISVEAHERGHAGDRPYRCDACTAAYTNKYALRRHLAIHSDDTFICDHCNRTFKQKGHLRNHITSMHLCPRFSCSQCPRRFTQRRGLDRHVHNKHTRPQLVHRAVYICPICNKTYASRPVLRKHMKSLHDLTVRIVKKY